jgi:haloalkane dehalogenase
MVQSWTERKSFMDVLGHRMAYIDEGQGAPIVFLHGNPTSSYLWRSVMAALEGRGRIIAPDMIGMGDSDKLGPEDLARYTFGRHYEFLDELLGKLGVTQDVVLVVHDWGGALGFNWVHQHRDAVRGIAYMETIVAPFTTWDEWPDGVRELFQAFRSPQGEDLVLKQNIFVEGVLLGAGTMRDLSDDEKTEHRRPFLNEGDDRLPTLMWPRQIPVAGEPPEIVRIVEQYGRWLADTPGIPKLFVNADPGVLLSGAQRDFCRTWPDQTEITVSGTHYLPEDFGAEIGQAIADWLPPLK